VIVVHRMLKNDVPVPEYLLMTEPVYTLLDAPLRERAAPHALELDDLGATQAYYLDLASWTDAPAPPRKLPLPTRVARLLAFTWRTLPYSLGLRKASGFRNLPAAG
jgi:hypothetical protein